MKSCYAQREIYCTLSMATENSLIMQERRRSPNFSSAMIRNISLNRHCWECFSWWVPGCRWCSVLSLPLAWRSPTSTRGRDAMALTSSHEQPGTHTHMHLPAHTEKNTFKILFPVLICLFFKTPPSVASFSCFIFLYTMAKPRVLYLSEWKLMLHTALTIV